MLTIFFGVRRRKKKIIPHPSLIINFKCVILNRSLFGRRFHEKKKGIIFQTFQEQHLFLSHLIVLMLYPFIDRCKYGMAIYTAVRYRVLERLMHFVKVLKCKREEICSLFFWNVIFRGCFLFNEKKFSTLLMLPWIEKKKTREKFCQCTGVIRGQRSGHVRYRKYSWWR